MKASPIKSSDIPLRSNDIDVCRRVVKSVCDENQIAVESVVGQRIARTAIDLYQDGLGNTWHLYAMLRAATGVKLRGQTVPAACGEDSTRRDASGAEA